MSSRHRAPAVWAFLAVSLVLSIVGRSSPGLEGYLLLSTGTPTLEAFFLSPLYYRHFTYMGAAFAVILVIGGILESQWGTPRFVLFGLFTAWGANLITLVTGTALDVSMPTFGAGSVALGLLVAAGAQYPDFRVARHAPPARHLVWIIVFSAGALMAYFGNRANDLLLPQVSSVPLSLCFLGMDPMLLGFLRRRQARRVEQDRKRVKEIRSRVDSLLEKISSEGLDSLTRDERSFLERASKHFRSD